MEAGGLTMPRSSDVVLKFPLSDIAQTGQHKYSTGFVVHITYYSYANATEWATSTLGHGILRD
jgi:hypothetical protein